MKSIVINNIVRETEKAILVNAPVSYNANKPFDKEIWMPRSVVKAIRNTVIDVDDWFVQKASENNAFHGYRMNFEIL